MTTTLVIGGPRNGAARHARSLLSTHPTVTHLLTREDSEDRDDPRTGAGPDAPGTGQMLESPDGWRVVRTRELSRSILGSRHPVLVDDLTEWLRGTLDDEGLWDDPTSAREVVQDRLDELAVAASAVPFDVVVLTTEPAWSLRPTEPRDAFLVDLLAHANERVSTVSGQVHAIVAGRVLDLTGAPAVGR